MGQWLPRGTALHQEKRIQRMIASGQNWQIYTTNQDTYVLAVSGHLYYRWITDYLLPKGIFAQIEEPADCWIFRSSGEYLVSSLAQGPYPENNVQIEAFSISFNTTLKLYPDADLHDALYIEEYSLILPSSEELAEKNNDYVYGKWLTGGVSISANSFARISRLMTWIHSNYLRKCFALAGFEVVDEISENHTEAGADQKATPSDTEENDADGNVGVSAEKFVLVGRPDLEKFFNDNIIDIVEHQEQYKRMGISFPGATILYGPPGCGKTYAVDRLIEYLGWQRFDIDSTTIASSFIHDTSKKISEVFNSAIKAAPSIIVIDEMEAYLTNRNASISSGTHHVEEVAEFLRRIPEAISKGVLVFAMTNILDSIDPAILRRGRFDHIVEVKMASKEEIAALLNNRFKELPVADNVDIDAISSTLANHPMSDVAFVIREAGRAAVKSGAEQIEQQRFEAALSLLPKKEEKREIGFNA